MRSDYPDPEFAKIGLRHRETTCGHMEASVLNKPKTMEEAQAQIAEYERQLDKEQGLLLLVERILQQDDLHLMMDVVFAYIQSLFESTENVAMFLLDTKTNSMARVMPLTQSVLTVSLDRGIAGATARTGQLSSTIDFKTSRYYDPTVDVQEAQGASKLTCIPLFDSSDAKSRSVFAVVQVLSMKALAEFDTTLLQRIGPILSQSLRKSVEYQDVVLSQRTQTALLHIASAAFDEETIVKLIQRVINGANHIVRSEHIALFLVDWPRRELWTLHASRPSRVPLDDSILGQAALTGRILNVKDATHDERFPEHSPRRASTALYVPIGVHHGTTDGTPAMAVLECINKLKAPAYDSTCEYASDDECALEAFASEVAVVLRRRAQETDYLKLLVDSTATNMAAAPVNLLQAFTSKPCTIKSHLAGRLCHAFMCPDALCGRLPLPPSPTKFRRPYSPSLDWTEIPSWDMDVFSYDSDQLLHFSEQMLLDVSLCPIDVDRQTLQAFVRAVHEHYHPNPFHNFQHGFSVLHVAYRILKDTPAAQVLNPLCRFACLVAGLCHDIDHPGHSNVYEVNSYSALALQHNDDAVLERHHAAMTFRLLKDSRVNILARLTPDEYRFTRKAIIHAIIGTDMAVHFDTIDALDKRFVVVPTCPTALQEKPSLHAQPWTVFSKSVEDRLFLVKAIVHAADLSAQVFPKPIALKWSNMIAKEFAYQALMESAEGLPVTHVHVDDPLLMVESQHFFAARLVAPLWISLVRFFPELDHCMVNLRDNIAHYEQEIRRLQAKDNSPTNEGQAVAGISKCTPAKFNSFRQNTKKLFQLAPASSTVTSDDDEDEYCVAEDGTSLD
ncbi:hypothetical protein Ae201684_009665 [Aphanomyces euteiches]|uniref:Phosphodiesterase n=1 Tax=Aphanomyces euteiches TaxID=100861 RepID=A0A6G0X0K6_9STRA|nr:hypothetical protein Ae201684_009665 [Aphanomyces euteiches]KAH9135805.1 hypothetical protein AeRB84_018855 [Aphanomyces euteiches]